MTDNTASIRQKLRDCELPQLFIEELGWNHHRAAPLLVESDGTSYTLNAVAEKHGMVAYLCQPGPSGEIPDYCIRGKIERQITKSAHEHIIVFVNGDKTVQTWQWVRREKGKPTARREHTHVCAQPGDSLIQKLQNLMISLEEEEKLTIVEVAGKVRQAFDVDRVTKRFYDRFKEEHKAFLSFIEGITAVADREWYASLMLNRLMFIYFIQKKGFLDGNTDYLRNRLEMVRQSQGNGKFQTFYRYFLRRLFHEGLAQRKEDRNEQLNTLLGSVPYLNGGLFDTHQLENDNPEIQIPDEAFERLFNFFDEWEWHLDVRPDKNDKEINPDVLGYIFEKYINQKQMGAYYTKEDITEYISKSTVVPFLFDAAEKKCAIAFRPDGAVWRLLRDDPDRYVYDAVRKGVDLPLPEEIAAGVPDVSRRGAWNRLADDGFALPTETWREHVARRTRCLELRAKLAAGEVHNINDFVTYNLDLRQFAQDAIETCEGPDLLRAFWKSIEELSVLDPTCGSGAFLFAALNILEPLYEACLDRMEAFVEELDSSGEKHHPEKFSDFRKVIDHANDRSKHPSRRYFVLKSIVLGNLYGVDIMAEAVEICKLRLFLKLVSQVERVEDVEPLPDIDFNIRAGNTLVGFTSLEALRQAMTIMSNGQHRLPSPEDQVILERINEDAKCANMAFEEFRKQQTDYGMQANQYSVAKNELQTRLAALRKELDSYLATEYGVDWRKPEGLENWQTSHQPFHWFVEFYGIIHDGGFDVVIGNPPWIEYAKVEDQYRVLPGQYHTQSCGNIYAMVIERCGTLGYARSRLGMIVQLSAICTDRMEPLQKQYLASSSRIWASSFDDRPAKLFDGLEHVRATIILSLHGAPPAIYTTRLQRWHAESRRYLFACTTYEAADGFTMPGSFPKVGGPGLANILRRVRSQGHALAEASDPRAPHKVYYYRSPLYWIRSMDFLPYFRSDLNSRSVHHFKDFGLRSPRLAPVVGGAINSSLFYMWFIAYGNGRNVALRDITSLPCPASLVSGEATPEFDRVFERLMKDYRDNSYIRERQDGVSFQEFYPAKSKHIIDEIDRVLAKHYGFTEEELDFIINYDIKYRMGTDSDSEDE